MKFLFILLFSHYLLFATELKIASYNIENLFDMQNNGTEYDEYKPNQNNWTQKVFKQKLLKISEVICDLNADIIGLQEIENDNALKQLQKTLKSVGCHYQYRAITKKKRTSVHVALLSKIPIESSKEIAVSQSLSYRNILEAKFMIDGNPLYIFVNHWASKRSPESKRLVSARTLVHRLKMLPKESEYIVLGDFNNDYDEHFSVEKTAINHVMNTVDTHGKFYRIEDLTEQKNAHYNLWLEQPNYRRWSHNFYGNKQALDAILLPSTLFNGKGLEYKNRSFDAFKKRYLFHKYGYLFRWQYKKNRHLGEGYSDHFPVYATFSTSKVFHYKTKKPKKDIIEKLLIKRPYYPTLLQKVRVESLSKNKAIISQESSNETIAVYGVEKTFKVGEVYDLMVYKRKKYKGQYELIDFEIEKRYDTLH